MRRKNNKNDGYVFPMSSVIDIKHLEKYWDLNLNNIKNNKEWKYYMQCNLFWDDKNKIIVDKFYYSNIKKNNLLFSSKEFYDFFSYKQKKLFDNKIISVIVISQIAWLYINSYYLKMLDEFNDSILIDKKIKTFFPYMNKKEKYLDSWKNYKEYLKKYIGNKYLKIDIKNFYFNINIDNFVYFCYKNYKYIKDNYDDFAWIFNLISYYSENESFPFLENCPFLLFCSSKLFLRKCLIEILNEFKYSIAIKKIIHYVDDIWIIFDENFNEDEINLFYDKVIDLFNKKNISLNLSKTKYNARLTLEDIETDMNSIEIMKINNKNEEKVTYNDLNEYLINFNNCIKKNKNKLMSFFDIEKIIKTPRKLKDFVFLGKNKIIGDLSSITFFENINSNEFINMVNYMPKYFILIFNKFLSDYDSHNNPFKLINREWENLSKEIYIYYSMIKTFKKIEKNTSEIILRKNEINKILELKNNMWFCCIKENKRENAELAIIQNMFFQIFYLYKKSKNHKYLMMFVLSCSVVIEMLQKYKKIICKNKECECKQRKKKIYHCKSLNLFSEEEIKICEKIFSYRNANSLTHNNFTNSKKIIFKLDFNICDLFNIATKILEFILYI